MTKEEFQALQLQQKESGVGLLQFLKMQSIKYSTYRYWCRKLDDTHSVSQPLAPISFNRLFLYHQAIKVRPDQIALRWHFLMESRHISALE